MESIYKYIQTVECARGGKMKWAILNENLHVGYINICSQKLPESVFKSSSLKGVGVVPIKINYCFHGRCEVMLGSGVTTFVVGNEFALDYGTSGNGEAAFFYPSSEYEGVELILYPSVELEKELSELFGVSESSPKNYFRAVFGRGYKEMIGEIRMQKAAELIMEGEKTMGEIAEFVGFQNQSRFSEAFFKYHKMLPMEYKRIKHIAKKDKNAV